jgi:universal stress protein E
LDAPAPHPQALRHAERDHIYDVIQKIMVVIDPTRSEQPALEKAARIATSYGSHLELYICDVEQDIPESWIGGSRSEEYREILRRRLLEDLERLAEPLRAQGLEVRTACEWHAPHEQGIGHHAIRTQPDLVVKETHWHAAMPRVTLTRTDWNLIRQVPAPLLLVRRTPWPERPRIAASVEPCHPADRPAALDEAIVNEGRSIANALTGEIDVVHVRRRVDCSVSFGEGDPATGILRLARESNANLLVMGAVTPPQRGHSAASGTAAQILERIDCDLLIVKPPGFVSPLLVTDD